MGTWKIEASDGNKHLKLVPTDENKDTLKGIKNYGTESEI